MRKCDTYTSEGQIRSYTSASREEPHSPISMIATLESLAADTWGKSLKRGLHSYKIKKQPGTNPLKDIIKIEDLDVRLIGTIKEKKIGLHNQNGNKTKINQGSVKQNVLVIAIFGRPFKCAVMEKPVDDYELSQNLVAITLKPHIPAAYVAAYLNSARGQKEFEKYAIGSPITTVTENNVKLLEIPLPPELIRQSVYEWFDHLYHYELALNQERDALSCLSTGILQKIGCER